MKISKNKRTGILTVILIGLLIIVYKMMFLSTDPSLLLPESVSTGEEVVGVLREVKNINFDTSITTDPRYQSLLTIEIPLPSLPVGKKNPFSASAN